MNAPSAQPADPRIILGRYVLFAFACLAVSPDLLAGSASGALGTILTEIGRWVDAIAGPFFRLLSIIAIVAAGIALIFMRIGQAGQNVVKAVIGILLAANAITLVGDLGASVLPGGIMVSVAGLPVKG